MLNGFFCSLLGYVTLTADLLDERLQTGVLGLLAEQERLCSPVVVRQSPRLQPDYVMCWFLSVGNSEESGNVWKHSECERGDLGVRGERLEWCSRQERGEHISEKEAGSFKSPPDAVSRVSEALCAEAEWGGDRVGRTFCTH